MRAFLLGVLTTIVVIGAAAWAVVWFGLLPAGADTGYFPFERKAANQAVDAQIGREMPRPPYPYGPPTDATIAAGAKAYMADCAVCHGSLGSPESKMAKGMYVKPPQFPKHGVDDDPEGETYWKIEHGYRFTGMPSFKGLLPEETIWQITYFLKHPMDHLPPAAAEIVRRPHAD